MFCNILNKIWHVATTDYQFDLFFIFANEFVFFFCFGNFHLQWRKSHK